MEYFTKEEINIIKNDYGTAIKLRRVLLNMFNNHNYPNVDLLGLMVNSDAEHLELFYKILKMPTSYINGRQILETFFNDENFKKFRKC